MLNPPIIITPEILNLTAKIDEFKGDRQLHKMLLQYSTKDTRHRVEYKRYRIMWKLLTMMVKALGLSLRHHHLLAL